MGFSEPLYFAASEQELIFLMKHLKLITIATSNFLIACRCMSKLEENQNTFNRQLKRRMSPVKAKQNGEFAIRE